MSNIAASTPDDTPRDPAGDVMALAYEHVRDAILQGRLKPGTWVSQVQLAADLKVSRTPLREALRRLQTEGLVQLDFNRRIQVSPLSIPDLETLYAMRLASEPLAVLLSVPQLGKEELAELGEAMTTMNEAAERGDEEQAIAAHRTFHFLLFSHTEDRLRSHVESMWDHSVRYLRLYHNAPSYRLALITMGRTGHDEIFEAAQSGDGRRTSRLVAEHLARTALTVIASVAGAHDPKMIRESLRFVLESAG
ncbi:GntR family transcriptional regulator [Streptomyces sp. OE57]|uniref:GntR family transcriptional regulator n=1 Tax=Streptomyces lacaronensis TaxID=3379885 RepID=UPI0039B730D9